MIVRRARPADVPAATIVAAAVAEEDFLGLQPPVDLDGRAARYRELVAQEAMWVLEAEGQILGYAAAPESTPGVLSIEMAIKATARGQGGGRALLAAIQDDAGSRKAHKISLEVWTDNVPAIALYAASGFEVEGLRRDHYRRRDGRLRSTLIMAWRVSDTQGRSAARG